MSFPTVTVTENATVTVIGPTTLQVVTVGVPGTPGTGSVTTAQYNALNAQVQALASGPVAWNNTTVALAVGSATPLSPDNVTTPVQVEMASAGAYADSTSGTIVQLSSEATNSGSRPTVAVLGEAVGSGASSSVTGGLFKGLGNIAGASATGVEVDYGNLTAAGAAVGLLVKASGVAATTAAIQVKSAASAAAPATGLLFDAGGGTVATSALVGTVGAPSVPVGIDLSGGTFSTAPVLLPNNAYLEAKTQNGASNYQLVGLDTSNRVNVGGNSLLVYPAGNVVAALGLSAIGGIETGYVLLDALGLATATTQSTSSTSSWATAISRAYTLPSGTWTVLLVGVVILVGNSSSDDLAAHLSNNTTEASGSFITASPGQDNTTFQMVGTLSGVSGANTYFIGYRVNTTGTMNAAKPILLIFGKRTA